jgi:hypothetical protein
VRRFDGETPHLRADVRKADWIRGSATADQFWRASTLMEEQYHKQNNYRQNDTDYPK